MTRSVTFGGKTSVVPGAMPMDEAKAIIEDAEKHVPRSMDKVEGEPYNLSPGQPAMVFTSNVMAVSKSPCNLMRDTDYNTEGFIIGRVHGSPTSRAAIEGKSEVDSFSGFSVITPAGIVVSASTVDRIYDGAYQLLGAWEDFELEYNGLVYGGYFEPVVYGVWKAVNPHKDPETVLKLKMLKSQRTREFVLEKELPKVDKELAAEVKDIANGGKDVVLPDDDEDDMSYSRYRQRRIADGNQ